jgi:hypothetical protein
MVGISRATGLHGKWKVGRHSRAAVRFCQRHEGCRERLVALGRKGRAVLWSRAEFKPWLLSQDLDPF